MAPLTKAEKLTKKEAKRLEKLRAKTEAARNIIRHKLQREITFHSKQHKEIDQQWRKILLNIKVPELLKDTQIMYETFERAMDKKDCYISHILRLINVAMDQNARMFSSFCDTIDKMIITFLSNLQDMQHENSVKTTALLQTGENAIDRIKQDHDTAETHLHLILYHAHTSADKVTWSNRGENIVKEEDESVSYANVRENLSSFLENSYNVMWENYKAVLKAYIFNTLENQKRGRKLRKKENIMADIIAKQEKKISSSDAVLRRLRLELQSYETGTKQATFRNRRNRYRAANLKMKSEFYKARNGDFNKLQILVQETDATKTWLTEAHAKAEKILKLATLCRPYESLREKVLPFGFEDISKQMSGKTDGRNRKVSYDLALYHSDADMERLWHKMSKAELSIRALLREKQILENDNLLLINEIKNQRIVQSSSHIQIKCICNKNSSMEVTNIPNATEGTLELGKYTKYYNNNKL